TLGIAFLQLFIVSCPGGSRTWSGNGHASVDAEHSAGDEAATASEEEGHGLVELAGASAATERRAGQQKVGKLLGVVTQLGGHLRGEEAGGDRVDADPVAAP